MKLHEGKFIYIYISGDRRLLSRWRCFQRYYQGPIILARSSLYRDILPPLLPSVIHRDDENVLRVAIYIYIRNACNDTTAGEKVRKIVKDDR